MDYPTFNKEMNEHYYRANCYHTMRSPDNDATSGNHHVINATYHLVSKKLGGYEDVVMNVRDFVTESRFINSTVVVPGLYLRHPNKKDQPQTHDDYIGIAVSSELLYPSTQFRVVGLDETPATYIYQWGSKHHWYFDPLATNFKFDSWHGRFPGLPGFYKRAAGQEISVLDRLGYVASLLGDIYLTRDTSATSGKILIWLQNSVMRGEGKMIDWAIDKWEAYIKKAYPTGAMGEVLGIYHGYDHPLAQAMYGKI